MDDQYDIRTRLRLTISLALDVWGRQGCASEAARIRLIVSVWRAAVCSMAPRESRAEEDMKQAQDEQLSLRLSFFCFFSFLPAAPRAPM